MDDPYNPDDPDFDMNDQQHWNAAYGEDDPIDEDTWLDNDWPEDYTWEEDDIMACCSDNYLPTIAAMCLVRFSQDAGQAPGVVAYEVDINGNDDSTGQESTGKVMVMTNIENTQEPNSWTRRPSMKMSYVSTDGSAVVSQRVSLGSDEMPPDRLRRWRWLTHVPCVY